MPMFYTAPSFRITDRQVATRGSAVGTLSDITNPNPYTFYQTASPGTAGVLNFTCTFTPAETIDSVHVVAENVTHVTVYNITASTSVITDQPTTETFNSRRALVFTSTQGRPTAATAVRVSLTKTNPSAVVKIYAIKVMRRVLDLSISGSERTITAYQPSFGDRSGIDIVEDLYGNRDEQRRHNAYLRETITYRIWRKDNNISACRQEINEIRKVNYDHSNFNFFDLAETGATDYEACYQAHFVPNSISYSLQGVNALSYTFGIERY